MATSIVKLEPQNITAAVRSLRAEFTDAKLAGVKTTARRGAVHVKVPIARMPDYQFSYDRECVSWRTPRWKVVIHAKGFAVEQRTDAKAFHLVFKKAGAQPEPAETVKPSPIRKIFFQRSLRAIEELQTLDERSLAEAVEAPTDFSVLVSALKSEEALASIRAHDPLAGARVRGLEAKRKLIEGEGGSLSSAEAAKLLRITRQAIDRRRKEGKLLGVELGRKGFRYPVWQFGLANFEPVLAAVRDLDSWEQLTFFLNPTAMLGGLTPLEALQGGKRGVDDVIRAASAYGEQGG
ncbi:MAG: hypothetical protein HXY18_13840 [Bryobacteraceae bacterium]|nr:hypothetical protein [Bryobacteraceae bacterium]